MKGGQSHGVSDEYGAPVVENPVHTHDFHATILHLMGQDRTRLTYRYTGRDFRLTDLHGSVVHDVIARHSQLRECRVSPALRCDRISSSCDWLSWARLTLQVARMTNTIGGYSTVSRGSEGDRGEPLRGVTYGSCPPVQGLKQNKNANPLL
jgi:Protein of unknown function (DUF1501)